jgi:hypothetical protein
VTTKPLHWRNRGASIRVVGTGIGNFAEGPRHAEEKSMTRQTSRLRRVTIAAIAATGLSLSMAPVAQAAPQPQGTPLATTHPAKHTAKPHWRQSTATHRDLYGAVPARGPAGCTWPYQNQFPPCMSTWPAGDPNYHGSRPGPTFLDEN